MSYLLVLLGVIVIFASIAYFGRRADRKARLAAPRITAAELDAFDAALAGAALPMAKVSLDFGPGSKTGRSRLGGWPSANAAGRTWPVSASGAPCAFLAEIDFSELPAMADFPTEGVLQIFLEPGNWWEAPAVPLWHPDGVLAGQPLPGPEAAVPAPLEDAFSERLKEHGARMVFEADDAPGNPFNWPHDETAPWYENRMGESPDVEARLERIELEHDAIRQGYGTHWIGGQPSFVQEDVRYDETLRHLDRVLLHLGWDDDVCIGDAGELNILISAEDLRARRFDRAYLTADCS